MPLTRNPRMLGRGVVDEKLPSDAPDQRRGTGDVEYGSNGMIFTLNFGKIPSFLRK